MNVSNGFWSKGKDEMLKALDQQEEKAIAPLIAQECTLKEQLEQTQKEIAEIKRNFKDKRKQLKGALFHNQN